MYLKELAERVEKISLKGANRPSAERQPEDRFIGVLPAGLRKLWVFWTTTQMKAAELNQEGREKFGDLEPEEMESRRAEIIEHQQECLLAEQEAELLKDIFWISVRRHFPELRTADVIGVRQGWQVVRVNTVKKAKQALKDLLRQFEESELDEE